MIAAVAVGLVVAIAGVGVATVSGRTRRQRARTGLRPADPTGPPAWFAGLLEALDLGGEPVRCWPAVRSLGALALVVLAVVEPGPALVVAVGAVVGPRLWSVVAARVGAPRRVEVDLPRVVDAWVASLGAGASLGQAVDHTATTGGPGSAGLGEVSIRHRRGEPLQVALDRWAAARVPTGAPLVADALALAGSSGASQVRALQRVAATLREREALRREVAALGAQARLSALVLVLVPLGFALVVAALDGRVRHVMVATPLGWTCLIAGVVLDLVGAGWMRRLVEGGR